MNTFTNWLDSKGSNKIYYIIGMCIGIVLVVALIICAIVIPIKIKETFVPSKRVRRKETFVGDNSIGPRNSYVTSYIESVLGGTLNLGTPVAEEDEKQNMHEDIIPTEVDEEEIDEETEQTE